MGNMPFVPDKPTWYIYQVNIDGSLELKYLSEVW